LTRPVRGAFCQFSFAFLVLQCYFLLQKLWICLTKKKAKGKRQKAKKLKNIYHEENKKYI